MKAFLVFCAVFGGALAIDESDNKVTRAWFVIGAMLFAYLVGFLTPRDQNDMTTPMEDRNER